MNDSGAVGRAQGHEKGVAVGLRRGIARLVEVRFGAAAWPQVEARVAADAGQLEQWLDRLVTAPSLDEAFEP